MAHNTQTTNFSISNSEESQLSSLSPTEHDAVKCLENMKKVNIYAASRHQLQETVLRLAKGGYHWAQLPAYLILKHVSPGTLNVKHTKMYHILLSRAQKRHPTLNALNPWMSTEFRRMDVECALAITEMHLGFQLGWEEFLHALVSSMPEKLPQTDMELLKAVETLWGINFPTLLAGYVLPGDQDLEISREDAITNLVITMDG